MKNMITLFSLLLLVSCGSKKTESESKETSTPVKNQISLTDVQFNSAGIVTGKMESRNISTLLKVNGKIDVPPQNMISVSVPLGGYLKLTKLLPGMHVRKGEPIAVIEDQQYIQLQQDYLTTKIKLEYSEADYFRQKELNKTKANSDKVFQQAQMEYNTLKITLSALSEKLKLININPQTLSENNISKNVSIYSPIDGYVSKVNVNIGKYVNPTEILFELVNTADIHLNLKIFEKDLSLLSIGQKLVAYTNNQPDKKHACEIILISQDLTAERTADVHCHFEDFDKTLLPGMYMNAEIRVSGVQTPALQEEAVVNYEGKNYAFVVNGNHQYQMIEIETGTKEKGFIETKNSAVFAGKQVVLKGAYTLLMALKNKPE